MKFVWDLDGVLVNTREANRQAYKSIGINPPEDFHVRDWRAWCSPAEHDAKGEVLLRFMRNYATLGPMFNVWKTNGKGLILSNASWASIDSILEVFPIFKNATFECNLPREAKVARLNTMPPGIYFDDSEATIQQVRIETKWTAILVR